MRQFLLFIFPVLFSALTAQTTNSAKEKHADSLLLKAFAVFYTNPDSSQYYTNLALNYADKNDLPIQKGRAWHSLARTEVLRGDIEPALKHLRDAAALFEKHGHARYLAKCYSLMSVAVGKINNHRESVSFLLKAEKLHKDGNDTPGLRSTYVNLANTYAKLNEYDKALQALNSSKKYSVNTGKDWYYYYINSGLIHEYKKNYSFAKSQYDSCLAIAQRHQMVDAEVTAATKIAELFYLTKQFKSAEDYFLKAIAMAKLNNLPIEESEALEGLVNYYVNQGNYKAAYQSKLRLDAISDSLFNIEKIKNINAVEARLKVSEKEKTIALQKLDMEKSIAEQEKSRRNLSFMVAGIIVLALILFLTIYVYVKTRRQKKEVELQKARAEKLNSLNQKIFAVIAHDFKSPMITLNMLLDLMENENISAEELRSYSGDVRHQLIQSGQILENLLNWARTELKLSSGVIQESNPQSIAEEIIKEMDIVRAKKNLTIQNDIPASMQLKIPADIFKIIIRNLLSNAVKFSYSGGRIIMGMEPTATFFIKDSGSGMSDAKLKQLFEGTVKSEMGTFNETGFGLGLYITNELVQKFKGTIWAESRENSGTVFKFVFPVHE